MSLTTVRAWHAQLHHCLGANSVAKCYRLLRTILETAANDELIARNPCSIKGAGVERTAERPVASIEQIWKLADEMSPRYRCFVLLAGFLGLRRGELLGLERRNVNLLHRTLRVEKQQVELGDGTLLLGPPKTDDGIRTIALPRLLAPRAGSTPRPLQRARRRGTGVRGRAQRRPAPSAPSSRTGNVLAPASNSRTASASTTSATPPTRSPPQPAQAHES